MSHFVSFHLCWKWKDKLNTEKTHWGACFIAMDNTVVIPDPFKNMHVTVCWPAYTRAAPQACNAHLYL